MYGKGNRENNMYNMKKTAKLKMKQKIAIKYTNNRTNRNIAKTQSVWGKIELL